MLGSAFDGSQLCLQKTNQRLPVAACIACHAKSYDVGGIRSPISFATDQVTGLARAGPGPLAPAALSDAASGTAQNSTIHCSHQGTIPGRSWVSKVLDKSHLSKILPVPNVEPNPSGLSIPSVRKSRQKPPTPCYKERL